MKLPLSWLHEQIALKQSPEELARLLTMAGLEVESLEQLKMPFQGVVVGRVTACERHPNADKLVVARVSDGGEESQVVCGAANCREGILVAWARPGSRVKELPIKVAKLRGVESSGMLCSADELGFSGTYDGILELPSHFSVGADLAEAFSDWLLDIAITPNLGHCASVVGIARELAAITGETFHKPESSGVSEGSDSVDSLVAVTVLDRDLCPRYSCRVIQGVTVGQSPQWLRRRLELCGIRSVNNVVDATNYVLLELGHPLHAFDFDKIGGREVVVRRARQGESITTLDGKVRDLTDDILVICDRDVPMALAGIMGGLDSEVGTRTTNILIESAYFQPTGVRRGSKQLGVHSEASRRFERGADPNGVLVALDRVNQLICELAGGTVARGAIDIRVGDFPGREVVCRVSRVNAILGLRLAVGEIESVFKRLGFPYEWDRKESFHVRVPTYRADILGEIDLIEEVARIYGYENIEKQPGYYQVSNLPHAPIYRFENQVREVLKALGLQEFLTCDLIGPTLLKIVEGKEEVDDATIRVLNPTSVEQSILRRSLLPGLLQVVKFNVDRRNDSVLGFETGRIHFKQGEFYREEAVAAFVLSGPDCPSHWDRKSKGIDFFDSKGLAEALLENIAAGEVTFQVSSVPWLHPGRQAAILVNGFEAGVVGEVHPDVLRRLDVDQRIYFSEVNLHSLFKYKRGQPRMEELPLYPASERDWTVTVSTAIPYQAVLQPVHQAASPLLEKVELIDLYRGDKVAAGYQNLTLRFTYRDRRSTLQQEAVDVEHERLTQSVLAALGGAAKSIGDTQFRGKT